MMVTSTAPLTQRCDLGQLAKLSMTFPCNATHVVGVGLVRSGNRQALMVVDECLLLFTQHSGLSTQHFFLLPVIA